MFTLFFKLIKGFSIWQWFHAGMLFLGLVGIGVGVYGIFIFKQHTQLITSKLLQESQVEETKDVVVSITGAVLKPGVVKLAEFSRWGEAVEKAGGVLAEADPAFLNSQLHLAEKVEDGKTLYIPFKNDTIVENSAANLPASDNTLVSINTSTQAQLETLDGVGEKRAQEIINGRPYQNIEELVERGILTASFFEKVQKSIKL